MLTPPPHHRARPRTRRCVKLQQLLTLEASALRVSHTVGERELELQLGAFKLGIAADSAFVSEQWAQAITEASMTKGLFLDPSEQVCRLLPRSSSRRISRAVMRDSTL